MAIQIFSINYSFQIEMKSTIAINIIQHFHGWPKKSKKTENICWRCVWFWRSLEMECRTLKVTGWWRCNEQKWSVAYERTSHFEFHSSTAKTNNESYWFQLKWKLGKNGELQSHGKCDDGDNSGGTKVQCAFVTHTELATGDALCVQIKRLLVEYGFNQKWETVHCHRPDVTEFFFCLAPTLAPFKLNPLCTEIFIEN